MSRFALKVTEQVDAQLLVRTLGGKEREPTDEELESLGYVSRKVLYERQKSMLAQLGDDETDPVGALRYFIEYIITYQHEPPLEVIEGMREILWPADSEP